MNGREELERLKAEHTPFGNGNCRTCARMIPHTMMVEPVSWPCPTTRLIAALEEALAQLTTKKGYDRALSKLAVSEKGEPG